MEKGEHISSVELFDFVRDAVLLDGGNISSDGTISVTLPPVWRHGLDDMPGYDADAHVIRLSTDMDVTKDSGDHEVGFLGRAHPLVRIALDRVRNISFGTQTQQQQDRRASVAKADVTGPQLLLTFLGRVSSLGGREYEQMIAVRLDRDSHVATYLSSEEWSDLAHPDNAIRTTDIWKNFFADWGADAQTKGTSLAIDAFMPIAEEFISRHLTSLGEEEKNHKAWIRQRADEILGAIKTSGQLTLLPDMQTSDIQLPLDDIEDPIERLSSFVVMNKNFPAKCREAETVLRIYKQRLKDREVRLNVHEPEIQPLGLLMIVPEGTDGA